MKRCNHTTWYIFSLIFFTTLTTSCKVIKESGHAKYNPAGEKTLIHAAIELSSLPGYGIPLKKLQKLKNETTNKQDKQIVGQMLFTVFANLDEIDTVKQLLYEQRTSKGNKRIPQPGDTLEVHDQQALNKVFEAAGKNKILMINESHYDWRHRYFVTFLLDSLYRMGYRYLAMEALKNDETLLKENYLVTTKTGYYFKEPFMANLARTALQKGFSLVPYEDVTTEKDVERFNSSVDKREYNQALNLYRHYKKDSTAGWLVLAGYSHINKESFSQKEPYSMARYFLKLSGIEPYSINQSTYSDIFSSKVPFDSISQSPSYFYLKPNQIQDSLLLKQADLYIINNLKETPYENNQATFTDFKKYFIKNDKVPIGNDQLIWKVFIKQEYIQNKEAIPIYIRRTVREDFKNILWLPENTYYLVVTDENDQVLFEGEVDKSAELFNPN